MNVNCVILLIAFEVNAEIEGDTHKITYLEPLVHLALNLPNGAYVRVV